MTLVLPSTVEELNQLQQHGFDFSSSKHAVFANKGFENIAVEKRYKREVSLPNGVADWNISNFESYLNFEESELMAKAADSVVEDDRLVPSDLDLHRTCTPSTMEDRRLLYQGMGVKAFNTVCVDSGSTCISTASDASYLSDNIFRGLDAEETYQNLDLFLQQVPEMTVTENLPSPLSSTDSNFDLSCLPVSPYSLDASSLPPSTQQGVKRPASSTSSEEEVYGSSSKHLCLSPPQYSEVQGSRRRSSTLPNKNCRKTRKEKQKEMEQRVSDLEKEKEGLRVEVQVLEELIQAHKMQLYAILQKR